MSKLPAGPAKAASTKSSTSIVVVQQDPALIFGLKRNVVLGILAVLVAGVAFAVWGPFGGDDADADAAVAKKAKGKGKGKAVSGKTLCAAVHCDTEQKAKLKPIITEYQEAIEESEQALQAAYASLGTAFTEESYDDGDLDEAYETIAEQNAAIEMAARHALGQVHEHLTPDQRDIVSRLVARDGPSSLFDRKSRGIPDRRVSPATPKRDQKPRKALSKEERLEAKAERREAKRARRDAKVGGAEGPAGSDDPRAVQLRRHGAGKPSPLAGLRPQRPPAEEEEDGGDAEEEDYE